LSASRISSLGFSFRTVPASHTPAILRHGRGSEALYRVADQTDHQDRGQGLLSRQEVARSRGLGLPAGAPLPSGVRLWLMRGRKRCWAWRRRENCAPKWGKPPSRWDFERRRCIIWRYLLNLMNSIRETRPNHGPMARNPGMGGGCRIIPDSSNNMGNVD